MRTVLALALAAMIPALPAQAEDTRCRAVVNGRETVVTYDDSIEFDTELGTGEKIARWPGRVWNKAWGTPPACDSRVLFTYLAIELPQEETDGYCLEPDPDDDGWLLVPGSRGTTAECSVTTCDRVNAAVDTGAALAGLMLTPPPTPAEAVAEPERLLHSSGALVLKGTAEWLAGSIGTAAPGVTAALTGPVAIGAAAASVVVIGSAVYVCSG